MTTVEVPGTPGPVREKGLLPRQDASSLLPRVGRSQVPLILASSVLMAFLLVPILIMVTRSITAGSFLAQLGQPVVYEAMRISLITTAISLVITVVIGTPVAWLLARYDFPGKEVLDTLVDLPMVLPPAVAGLAMLIAFGRAGILGQWLGELGITLPFTTAAVVMAQLFVASPFYVRAARTGFQGVDVRLERVAATLGVPGWRIFLRVTLPLAFPALLGGAVMAWARALGEFGATIMFAGSFVGRTQTMSVATYAALETNIDAALAIATILVVVSFAVLLAFRLVVQRQLEGPLHA